MRVLSAILLVVLVAGGCAKQRAVDHYVDGLLLAQQGQDDAALTELTAAIKDDPKLSVAHAAIGDIFRKRGDYDHARTNYENACLTDPYAFRPHYNLGITCQVLAGAAKTAEQVQQYLRDAVRVYQRAAAIEPKDFDTQLNLSACYYMLGKYDLAEQSCQAALKLNDQSPQAHGNLATIYDSLNRFGDAVKEYKVSLELDANQPELLQNLGVTYMRQAKYNAAIGAFDAAIRLDPNCAAAYEQIGACNFHLRQYEPAKAAYAKAIAVDPASGTAHRGLGVVCMAMFIIDPTKTDLRAQALACWRTSLELQPGQKDLARLLEKYEVKEKRTDS